ncbi:prepilin-type N-terminal cleavage/methylation domain-containing protein [Luteibacter sp.]|jgi:general secretion pathway protein I|uniref:prepilin-type N-terminal cleavage/methylation domain-containing protein n=1 Tax=Luteibacter sp. TaxID=1886636 RepID=UPI002F419A07
MRRRSHQGQRGFTLLEVIAAIAVLAVAFAALMQVAGSSLRLTAKAGDRSIAALHARAVLDGAYVVDPLQPGVTQGKFDDNYRWRLTVSPWQPPGQQTSPLQLQASQQNLSAPRLFRLDLEIGWGNQTARFSTLRLAPPPGATGVGNAITGMP